MKSLKNKKLALLLTIVVLILLGGLVYFFVLRDKESSTADSVKNETTSNAKDQASEPNTVNYGPANPADNYNIPDKTVEPTAPQPQPATEIYASITSTRYSSDRSQYLIKVEVTGTENGQCSVTMAKDSQQLSDAGSVIRSGGGYACDGLSIDASSLSKGTWSVRVNVQNGSASTAAETEVVIE